MSDKKKGDEGGFLKFLWNGDTSEFLGRTGSSWAKIIVFYIIFFAGLAAFFLLMLYIFFLTLDLQKPKWQMTSGLIGDNPGVGFRPQPDQDKNVDSTLIWFDRNRKENYEFWSTQLDVWFNAIPAEGGSDVTKCSFGNGGTDTYKDKNKKREQISSCFVDNKQFGECNPENKFGYRLGEPCILVKLNRIYGWEPEGFGLNGKQFNPTQFDEIFANDLRDLEKDIENNPQQGLKIMPKFLQDYIKKEVAKPEHSVQWKTDFLNSVFFSCEGENPADKENIGPISFFPHPYIPSYYFPFTNQRGYQSPFVMVQMKRPMPGVLINVECRGWAKNIHQNRPDRLGMVHFEMMID